MRTATCLGALALILAAVTLTAAADDKKDKFDAAKLVGKWNYVSGDQR